MKIKTKLMLALSLLFLMIVAISVVTIKEIRRLSGDTRNILVANYQSLDYSRNMYKLLESIDGSQIARTSFAYYLDQQMRNVTEEGEQELTNDLRDDYRALLNNSRNPLLMQKVRGDLNSIMKLNMDSIKRKSAIAEKTADSSVLWISLASAFCLIISFTLIINLPGYIADPIRGLTESIRQIAAENYSQRVYFKGHDEFVTLARSFNTMAEKLQEYSNSNLEKLMMEKRRIETLVSNLNEPVIGLDERNNILFINDEAIKISGLVKEKVIGRQAEEVALYNDLLRSLLQQASQGAGTREPLKIYANNRESYFEQQHVKINIIPTGETDPKPIGSFIILKNITPYKELDFAKTNFIATVSHEFKTPIAAMKLSLQLLDNEHTGHLNDEQRNLVASIKDDADRLLRTTGELLNISQVETGKTAISPEPINVASVVDEAANANAIAAGSKNITLNVEVSRDLPPIMADREKSTWIISNLISNAIRYSHEHSQINIIARAEAGAVHIMVTDSGIGIPEEYLPRIFEKYFRVPGTAKEGTGLGLAISKEFMEAQGGSIYAHSSPGSGSTFTVTFKTAYLS